MFSVKQDNKTFEIDLPQCQLDHQFYIESKFNNMITFNHV